MPPALEVYHVPPEGQGKGKFIARLQTGGASAPDEDGEPGDEVYVAYELDRNLKRLVLFHTWTPSALRGKGLAARVCEEAFAWAEANDVSGITAHLSTRRSRSFRFARNVSLT